MGFEPTTLWTTTRCSNQLSYNHHSSACTSDGELLNVRLCLKTQRLASFAYIDDSQRNRLLWRPRQPPNRSLWGQRQTFQTEPSTT